MKCNLNDLEKLIVPRMTLLMSGLLVSRTKRHRHEPFPIISQGQGQSVSEDLYGLLSHACVKAYSKTAFRLEWKWRRKADRLEICGGCKSSMRTRGQGGIYEARKYAVR